MTTNPYRPNAIPPEILALSHERDILRRRGNYKQADILKQQLEDAGYVVKDNPHGAHLIILPGVEVDGTLYRTARQMPSFLKEADSCTFSVNLLAQNTLEQTQRSIESIQRYAGGQNIEIVLVDNASRDDTDLWIETIKYLEPRLRYLRATRLMGVAEARNIGLKRSKGRYILLLDPRVELTGDIFTPLAATLANEEIGITGLHGLHTDDLRHFTESSHTEVEVVDQRCMAFRRKLLNKTGLFDERYRHEQYMDIDFNFAIKEQGKRAVITPNLPAIYHPEQLHPGVSDAEQMRLNKRNFYRFLDKWGDRDDLLLDE